MSTFLSQCAVSLVLALWCLPAFADSPPREPGVASRLQANADSATLTSMRPAQVSVWRIAAGRGGLLQVAGRVHVNGRANLVLWARVDGADYFSRLPALQQLTDVTDRPFSIPFNAGEHVVSDLFLEVEMLSPGQVTVSGLRLLP